MEKLLDISSVELDVALIWIVESLQSIPSYYRGRRVDRHKKSIKNGMNHWVRSQCPNSLSDPLIQVITAEVGIYKSNQESKSKRKKKRSGPRSDQENDHEKKIVFRLKNINQFHFNH